MRWLPFLLVVLSALFPIENLVSTLESELIIRSTWSVILCLSLYFCINHKIFAVILICEFIAIGYNLAIACGYFFTDKDLAALYEPMMMFLFFIELYAVLPRRTRRDSRDSGDYRNRYRRRSYGNYDLSAISPLQVDSCKA